MRCHLKAVLRAVPLLGFAAVLLSPARGALAATDALEQVTKIFAVVDGPTDKKAPTLAAYSQLQKLKPDDKAQQEAQYAYLVGLIQLRKSREATTYAAELLQRRPYDVRVRLHRARLLLHDKKFAEAFVELEASGKSIAEQAKQEKLDLDTEISCRALGLMFGYIEGPAKPIVKATLGKGVKERVMASFSTAAKDVFNEQYDAVLEEQEVLAAKGEDALRELEAKHREASDAALEKRSKLEEDKAKTDEKKKAVIDQLTKKWDSAKAEYDKLLTAFQNLQNTHAQLINQRALLARQASAAFPRQPQRDRSGNISHSAQEQYNRDKVQYDQMVRQVNSADQQILQNQAALQQLAIQGGAAEAKLVELQAEGERLGVEFALKERAFAKQENKLNRTDPTKKKLPATPPKHVEQAFAQYDDFNYEQEKQRLLDSLRESR